MSELLFIQVKKKGKLTSKYEEGNVYFIQQVISFFKSLLQHQDNQNSDNNTTQ